MQLKITLPNSLGKFYVACGTPLITKNNWGDANDVELDHAVMAAGLMYDVRFSSLVAAYRADDLKT